VNSVRVKNLALLSLTNPLGDVLLFGMGKPLKALAGKIAGKGLLAKGARAVVERGIPYVLGAAPEGVEGGSQEAFQKQAAGQPLDWGKIKEAGGSEALASLLYGLVGRGICGGASVLLGSQADTADSGGGKPGEPPAPPPASGETSQTDEKNLPSQERVRSKLLELREKIVSSYLGPGPHYKGSAPELNWDNKSSVMKKQVLRLRKAMELWDDGKYDEAERLASLLKDEMMPEKDTPLWAPVEETAEPAAETEEEAAQGETAEPSMPISEAADQVLAATPETQTESGTEEKKAGTIRIGNREISIVDTDDSDENGPTGGGIVRRGSVAEEILPCRVQIRPFRLQILPGQLQICPRPGNSHAVSGLDRRHVVAHRRLASGEPEFVLQAGINPFCRMALLLRAFKVLFQPFVNDFMVGAEHRIGLFLPGGVSCEFSPKVFLHCVSRMACFPCYFAHVLAVHPVSGPYVFVLIHPEHPFSSGIFVVVCITADDTRSDGQVVKFRLSFAQKVVSFRIPKPAGATNARMRSVSTPLRGFFVAEKIKTFS